MIRHVCDFCGSDLPLNTPITIYKIPVLNKVYATHKGVKLADFAINTSTKEVELCNSCEWSLARFLDGMARTGP